MNETPDSGSPDPAPAPPPDKEAALEASVGAHGTAADRGARLLKPSGRRGSTTLAEPRPAVADAAPAATRCSTART